jgi:hypothetical protein
MKRENLRLIAVSKEGIDISEKHFYQATNSSTFLSVTILAKRLLSTIRNGKHGEALFSKSLVNLSKLKRDKEL